MLSTVYTTDERKLTSTLNRLNLKPQRSVIERPEIGQ